MVSVSSPLSVHTPTNRCKLGFPAVGEVVCLVRSGCLLHLRHYGQLPDYATAPLPPPAAELNAAAEVVKSLPPVSKYKVVAVAYCQYPKPTPPPVPQQQQQLLEAAGGSAQLGQNTAAGGGAAAAGGDGGGPAMHQGQQQAVQQVQGAGFQQPPQQQQGVSRGSSKKSRSRSRGTEWGLGYEDEFEDQDERSEESESNSEDDEFNDRHIRLTGIDSDADAAFGSQQQGGGSQSLGQQSQQPPSQQQQQANGDAGTQQPNSITPQQQQPQQPVVVQQRPPCMWVLLSPVSSNGSDAKAAPAAQPPPAAPTPSPPPGALPQQEEEDDQLDDFFGAHLSEQAPRAQAAASQLKLPCLAVPLHIDSGLPDYLVAPGAFDASLQRRWLPQDRCSMFIGHRQVRRGAECEASRQAGGQAVVSPVGLLQAVATGGRCLQSRPAASQVEPTLPSMGTACSALNC